MIILERIKRVAKATVDAAKHLDEQFSNSAYRAGYDKGLWDGSRHLPRMPNEHIPHSYQK
jgi:hypothetical protein